MEGMLAEEVDSWEIQSPPAGHAPASLEHDWFASQLLEFLFLVLCFSAIARYQAAILRRISLDQCADREGGVTNPRYLFALPLDVIAEILLYSPHCYHCIVAQSLDDLKW